MNATGKGLLINNERGENESGYQEVSLERSS